MSEQTQPASSPAEVADVFNGENVSLHEFSKFRETGEVPDRFKEADKADAASAEHSPEGYTLESVPDSETDNEQERPKPKRQTASDRIAQIEEKIEELWQEEEPDTVKIAHLTATIEKIERGAGIKRKAEVATVTSSQEIPQHEAQPAKYPQTYADWEKTFDPEKWMEEFAKANPNVGYERMTAAMFSHMLNVRDEFKRIEDDRSRYEKEFQGKVAEAQERYGDSFVSTVVPAATAINKELGDQNLAAKLLNSSPYLSDILFTLGGEEATLQRFIRTAKSDPSAAIRYVVNLENDIAAELTKESAVAEESSTRNDKGQFTAKETPAKPKTTSAPKPPAVVSGGSTSAFDVSDESLSPEEWARKRTEDLKRRSA